SGCTIHPSRSNPLPVASAEPLVRCSGCALPLFAYRTDRVATDAQRTGDGTLAYPLRQTAFDLLALLVRENARATLACERLAAGFAATALRPVTIDSMRRNRSSIATMRAGYCDHGHRIRK